MLLKNGELLKLEKEPEFQSFVKHKLPALPNPVCFRYPRHVEINPTGLKEEAPVFNILATARVEGSNGLEEWAYTERLKRDNALGMYVPDSNYVTGRPIKNGELQVPHKRADLIFFLMEKSRQYGKSFVVDDKVKQAAERVEKKARKADLEAAIYSSLSPLKDDALLRDVAAAWGIPNADTEAIPILKEKLESKVLTNENETSVNKTAWGIDVFLEKINSGGEMKRRAVARRALDQDIVVYDEMSFYFKLKDSNDKLMIVPQEAFNHREDYFVNQVLKENVESKRVWQVVKKEVITPELIDSWDKPSDYMWLVEEEGIPKNVKKEEKIAKLKEIYG